MSLQILPDELAYGLKPEVWGRVVPDPRAELQVDPARGPQAQGLGRPIGNTSLCVASPEQVNSHSSDVSYHGEQGYNKPSILNYKAQMC